MNELPRKVFRYMDEKYIDEFLQYGRIRLTTLKKCREIECETRKDETEGRYHFVTNLSGIMRDENTRWLPTYTDEAGNTINNVTYGIFYYSINCFLLCLSTECSKDMQERFSVNACLSINNLEGFYQALSKSINKIIPLCEDGYGLCLYADENPENSKAILNSIDLAPFCINCTKPSKYKPDKEARIVWVPYPEDRVVYKKLIRARKYGYKFREEQINQKYHVARNPLPNQVIEEYEYLDIVCPEAITFCEKYKF